jgi:hypothetical protein
MPDYVPRDQKNPTPASTETPIGAEKNDKEVKKPA